jgi:hypothetical protein
MPHSSNRVNHFAGFSIRGRGVMTGDEKIVSRTVTFRQFLSLYKA